MTAFDMPLDQLYAYRPEREEPPDFDAFWTETLDSARSAATPPAFERRDGPLRTLTVDDVSFSGFGGQRIKGWFLAPAAATAHLPTVVEYIGYGGGRSEPTKWLDWASAGYGHLVMDTRGQGSAWSRGDTPDLDVDGGASQYPGFVTRGIAAPSSYYYRRLITDAVLAVDAASVHPVVDRDRIIVAGESQGGGLALAVAALSRDVRAACIDVPFMCHWRRSVDITDELPYHELTRYLAVHRENVEAAFATLSYHDGLNFASRATAPALFSAGLRDEICPPSTVFAAFNHYAGPHDIRVWPFNGHEGGEVDQQFQRYAFLAGLGVAP